MGTSAVLGSVGTGTARRGVAEYAGGKGWVMVVRSSEGGLERRRVLPSADCLDRLGVGELTAIFVGDSPDVIPDDVLGYAPGDGLLAGGDENSVLGIVPQFNSCDSSSSSNFPVFPLGLSLDQGRPGFHMAEESSSNGSMGSLIRQDAEVKTSSEAGSSSCSCDHQFVLKCEIKI
ncbi:hypothetical protein KSP39_PZI012008 [Platanthera zijinensis]|uniref:Uncharacterized protein n=1 Tax=Platanthera zijinensis TaxID=2320716 RepID=A0AAP0G4Q5_9ASPA